MFLDKPLVFHDLFNTLRMLALAASPGGKSRKKTILVFDDSRMVLDLMRGALEAQASRLQSPTTSRHSNSTGVPSLRI